MALPEFSKEDLEELKEWSKDPRGAPFWQVLREMFKDGVSRMRQHARKGEAVENAFYASHVDTLEEVSQLPEMIIEEHAEKARQEDKSGKKV